MRSAALSTRLFNLSSLPVSADAVGGAIYLSGDMRLMSQPAGKITIRFADRDSGIRDVDLDVIAPIAGIRVGRAGGIGLVLQVCQTVKEQTCNHVPRETSGRHVRRHLECFDDKSVIMRRRPDDAGNAGHDRSKNQCQCQFERQLEHIADVPHAQGPVTKLVFATQILDLEAREFDLFARKTDLFVAEVCLPVEIGIRLPAAGAAQRQRPRNGIDPCGGQWARTGTIFFVSHGHLSCA